MIGRVRIGQEIPVEGRFQQARILQLLRQLQLFGGDVAVTLCRFQRDAAFQEAVDPASGQYGGVDGGADHLRVCQDLGAQSTRCVFGNQIADVFVRHSVDGNALLGQFRKESGGQNLAVANRGDLCHLVPAAVAAWVQRVGGQFHREAEFGLKERGDAVRKDRPHHNAKGGETDGDGGDTVGLEALFGGIAFAHQGGLGQQ